MSNNGNEIKINEITIKRKVNLGNYESLEVGASISPSSDSSTDATVDALILQLDCELLNAVEKITNRKASAGAE